MAYHRLETENTDADSPDIPRVGGTTPGTADGSVKAQPGSPAARMAGLATNILAIGLILILGVISARQALRWWSAAATINVWDPQPEVVGPAVVARKPSAAGQAPSRSLQHLLAFGDESLLAARTELRGDLADVLARLRADCRAITEKTERVQRVVGPAEQRMLARIGLQRPVESTSRWRMYQLEGPVPLVVTVLDQPVTADTADRPEVGDLTSRVVSWGLAFPAVSDEDLPQDRWTLFTLTADNPTVGALTGQPVLPQPPQSRRTLSLQAETGATMLGFRGAGSVSVWQTFYNRKLAAPAWTPATGWRQDGPVWQRSFTGPHGRLDVQLIEEADGSLNGLLMSAPPITVAPGNRLNRPRRDN